MSATGASEEFVAQEFADTAESTDAAGTTTRSGDEPGTTAPGGAA
jgi:hypothetical protein